MIYVHAVHRMSINLFLTDASLTTNAVLSCLETVEDIGSLRFILQLPASVLIGHHLTREKMVQFYLQVSPCASWEDLASRLLYMNNSIGCEDAKKRIKPGGG